MFYATYDQKFPSESEERAGYWVGFGEHCGDAMTHKLVDHETQKIIYWIIIYRSALRPKNPEFQELVGYILIFLKALYGLKSSGKRWAEVIHGILRDMKFLSSKADPCIWLRKALN